MPPGMTYYAGFDNLAGQAAGQLNLRKLFGSAKTFLFDQDRPQLADFMRQMLDQHLLALRPQASAERPIRMSSGCTSLSSAQTISHAASLASTKSRMW